MHDPDPTTTIAAAIDAGDVTRAEGERLLAHLILVRHGVSLAHLLTGATYYRRRRLARRLGFSAAALGPIPVT